MKKLFKKRYTKWIPFGNYRFSDTDYIVFVRKNKKNGLMQFKTVKVHNAIFYYRNNIVPMGLIDTKAAWEKILSM